ncbi:MAG TPA: glycosyltransferase family 87 protein [Stellaceae bacterium]|nr:glycosyltransferase family 87 protein [Stellaceae bacterium]
MSAAWRRAVAVLRSGEWLDPRAMRKYAALLLALETAGFLFLIAGTHGWIVPLTRPTTTDFVSFYAAGQLANAGTPWLAYNQAAHYAAEQLATAPGIEYQFFYYPPVFLLLCALLARLPYYAAFIGFEAATLAGYLCVACAILRERDWRILLPLLAFPAVFWTLGLGQNAFLTAALFGAATLTIDRRPILAGLLFGTLCYKPHFGLLVPLALACGGRWRAFAAAAAATLLLCGLSLLLFGAETWQAFAAAAGASPAVYQSGRIDLAGFTSPFGLVLTLGGAPTLAYLAQAIATTIAATLVAWVWLRRGGLAERAATLAAAAPIAAPVALLYDLMLGSVAALWLVRSGREAGFLPWEKSSLAALFVMPIMARGVGDAWHVPIAALTALGLLALAAGRLWRRAGRLSAATPAAARAPSR